MSKTKTKRYLVLLSAIGLIVAGLGGSGTFASFNAQTTNAGNFFATGTLFLHNNGGTTTCKSEEIPSNNNMVTNGCDVLFSVAPLTDTTNPNWAHLTLTNAGSIDAVDIKFDAPGTTACTSPASTFSGSLATPFPDPGPSVTTLHLTSFTGSIAAGDPIVVSQGAFGQTFTATQDVTGTGSVTVTVKSVTPSHAFTTGASVGNAPTFGSDPGLCSGLQFIIVETTNTSTVIPSGDATDLACSYGVVSATPPGCQFSPTKTLANLPNPATAGNTSPVSLVAADGTTAITLAAGQSRNFLIGIKPALSLTNPYQNRRAQFDLHWQIDSA